MGHPSLRRFSKSFFLAGLLAVFMSLGGAWGEAYGQTAGPTPTPGGATLSLSKTVDRSSAAPGDTVVFTIRVQNTGSAPAQNVTVRDDVPSAFEVTGASASAGAVTISGPTVSLAITRLNPGETIIITVTTRIRPDARGDLSNTVVATLVDNATAQQTVLRATAVLGVAAEADDESGADNGADGTAGNATNVGDAAGADDGAPRSQLSNTGADAGLQWPLFVIGVLCVLMGSVLFIRSRKTT